MKKASPKPALQVVPLGVCTRQGCGRALSPSQKKFCSHTCRNMVMTNRISTAESEYKPTYAKEKLKEYLLDCEQGHKPEIIETKTSQIVIHNARLPTLAGYAIFLGYGVRTLEVWAGQYNEFAVALDNIREIQKEWLINNGLGGRYNAKITQLLLGVNHGMVEKKEVDLQHKMIGVVKHVYNAADKIERGV